MLAMLIYRVVLKEIFHPLIDLIYPKNCLICHNFFTDSNQNSPACKACWDKIEYNLPPICNICGRHIQNGESACEACRNKEFKFTRAWSVVNYDDLMRHLIHLFKYRNKTSLSKPFARLMADFFQNYNLSRFKFDYLIAVPLHPARFREREYNQSQLICAELARILGMRNLKNNLKRIKYTAFQSSLNENERFHNIEGAFALRNHGGELLGKNILLIDDLLTTGATCSEAAGTLRQAGANQVYVLTLAVTP